MNIESIIFSNLIFNEEYARKTIPFLKVEYFQAQEQKVVFSLINNYIQKYNSFPTLEALAIDLSVIPNVNEHTFEHSKQILSELKKNDVTNLEWLLDNTEKFCQQQSIYNAVMETIQIMDDKTGKKAKGSIPQLLSDALSVSFDTQIGHDFFEDHSSRYDFYHAKEVKIPFDLEYFNSITGGGLPKKTLNIIMATTGVGKSLFMCHFAAANLMQGKNVLYITLEMAEEKIAERIDANLLDISLEELKLIDKEAYERKMSKVIGKSKGKLIIKEYPTACASSANFRHLLNELKIKKNFVPDIIYIDYLNICSSARIKNEGNSYNYVKTIAEELRGLAVEFDVPIISATQANRGAYGNSDIDLQNTSESIGLPATCDMLVALISSDELEELNQILVKQLKNRYGDLNKNKRFVVGIDRSKMKLFDVEQSAQENILDGPVMDNSKFGEEDAERGKPKKKKWSPKDFEDFK